MQPLCLKCKGRGFCGKSFCPIYAKSQAIFKVEKMLDRSDFSSSSPAPFVGHYGYPNVNVGVLSPARLDEKAELYDAPRYWAEHNFKIPEIVDLRSSLINSRFKIEVKKQNKFLDISKEVGMASKPVDVELSLDEKPRFKLKVDSYNAPMGPNAKLKNVQITSNPKISHYVEKVVDDIDLKAKSAVLYLHKKDFDENFLTKLLSVGNIGLKKNRKLVPTRWSITATDDMIAKELIEKIKDFKQADYLAFFGSYLGNYFLILLFPEPWSYELFETYMPKSSWNVDENVNYTTDYEPYYGRKTYAENCAGGYYAARLSIAEKLEKMKKQASILALRFITGEYAVPLGVWVVREAVRKTMKNRPIEFASKELMLKYAELLIKKKFNYDVNNLLKNSILLRNIKNQTKLNKFLK
ncbi:MAG: Nre family DNA repair protein [Nanoarchaeota archaeon]|nr:Nre family DNA repair protein [Nanoarchaeota archaeon]